MIEILARGKRLDNKEWVKGCLIIDYITGKHYIHAYGNSTNETDNVGEEGLLHFAAFEIDEESICMCTGKQDVAGELIFENDIVDAYDGEFGKVIWDEDDACFYVEFVGNGIKFGEYRACDFEIRGNIFDNPELLEGGAE